MTSNPAIEEALDLTLILVSYHSQEPLERFFQSAREHPIQASHEILVIDNAAGDGTGDWLASEHPHVTVVDMASNVGYAAAVNEGISRGRGRAFLVINPDVELSAEGVDSALRYLDAHEEVGVVGARLLNADGTMQRSARRFYTLTTILLRRTPLGRLMPRHPDLRRHLMLDDDLSVSRPVDWIMGAWMLVRREAVERVGSMDDRFFLYFEDVDWCYRMWEGGYEVHYFPQAEFVHQYQRSSGRVGKTLLYHLRSFFSFYDKWGALVYVARQLRSALEVGSAVLTDVVLLNLGFLAAFFLRRALDPVFPQPLFDLVDYRPLWLFFNALALVTLLLLGRYRRPQPRSRLIRWIESARSVLMITLILMAGTYLSRTVTFSRAVVLLLAPCTLAALEISRALQRRILAGRPPRTSSRSRALLLGRAHDVWALAGRLSGPDLVVAGGIVPASDAADAGVRVLGAPPEATRIVENYRISEVLVAAAGEPSEEMMAAATELASAGLPVRLAHPWARALGGEERTSHRHGLDWIPLEAPPLCSEAAWIKPLLDRALGAALCLLSLPGFVLCSTLGRWFGLVDVRTVQRLGRGRRSIRWRELVSRRTHRPLLGGVQFPLFRQVLAGGMSLVGPYPLPPGLEEELSPIQLLRFAVKPGLTGPWQKRLREPHVPVDTLLRDDLEYLERWSLSLDLDLLLSAIPHLLGRRDRWHRLPTGEVSS